MSRNIDENVVSMEFDNQKFESNVKTSMSTIEKLKRALKFEGATKGLEDVDKAANKLDWSKTEVAATKAGFHIQDVFEKVTRYIEYDVARRIANVAKGVLTQLTTVPIKTGFQEYETQMNAVQTILANTQKEGATIQDVNRALDELNAYADLTIYNFTEMTRNIGTFTAAGVDLKTSVGAIQGIANLAAVSGSTSQQASTAMYQLSQALSSGTVKLMDWNSVVNAGMGGQVFQDALIKTSERLGTGAQSYIDAEGSFRESLSKGWLTAEVLTETLKKFTTSGANEYIAEVTKLTKDEVEAELEAAKAQYGEEAAISKAAEALANKSGYNKQEIEDVLNMARTATDAATKVKTLTQLYDVLKEAAQSGWSQSWRIILGNFEESKELFTKLSNIFSEAIGASADRRNAVLAEALSSKWEKYIGFINEAGMSTEEYSEILIQTAKDCGVNIEALVKEHGSLSSVVAKGLIPAEAFNKSLEKIQTTTEATTEALDKAKQHVIQDGETLIGIATKYGMTWQELYELNKEILANPITNPGELYSGQALKTQKYTEQQIKYIEDLQKKADAAGVSMNELIESMSKPSGRELLIDSLLNAINAIKDVLSQVRKSWNDVFYPGKSEEEIIKTKADRIYRIAETIHTFSERLKQNEETLSKWARLFNGIFKVIKAFVGIIKGGFTIAFNVLKNVLANMNIDILDFLASVGDLLGRFADWVQSNNFIVRGLTKLVELIIRGVKYVRDWAESVGLVDAIREKFSKFGDTLRAFWESVKQYFGSGKGVFTSFFERLKKLEGGFTFDNVKKVVIDLWNTIKAYFDKISKEVTPLSQKFEDFKASIINAIDAIKQKVSGGSSIGSTSSIFDKIKNWVNGIDMKDVGKTAKTIGGLLLSLVTVFGFLKVLKANSDSFSNLTGSFGKIADGISEVVIGLASIERAFKKKLKAETFRIIATSILILVAALAGIAAISLYGNVWEALGVLTVLTGLLIGMFLAVTKLAKFSPDLAKAAALIASLSALFMSLALVLLIISSMNPEKLTIGLTVISYLTMIITGLTFASKLAGGFSDRVGKMISSLAIAFILIAFAIKIMGGIKQDALLQGMLVISYFSAIVGAFIIVSRLAGQYSNLSAKVMTGFASSLLIIAVAFKLMGLLKKEDIINGITVMSLFGTFAAGMIFMSKYAGQNAAKAGFMLLEISAALLIMVSVIKLAGLLDAEDIKKGLFVVGVLSSFIGGLIAISHFSGTNAIKVGLMMIEISLALVLFGSALFLIGTMDEGEIKKALSTVVILMTAMAGVIYAAGSINDTKISKAIVILASALLIVTAVGGILYLLDKYVSDSSKVLELATALGLIITALSGAIVIISKAKVGGKGDIKKFAIAIVAMTAMVAPLYALIGALALMQNIKNAERNVLVLGAFLAVLAAAVIPAVVSTAMLAEGRFTKNLAGVGLMALAMVGMMVPLYALIGALALMQNISNVAKNAAVLGAFLVEIVSLVGPIALLSGALSVTGPAGLWGVLIVLAAMVAIMVPVYALIGALALMQNITGAEQNAKLINKFLLVMTNTLMVLAAVGPLALIGVVAFDALALAIGAMVIFALGLGALVDVIPDIKRFLEKGVDVMIMLAEGLGKMIGAFLGGILEGIVSTLPGLADSLSDFAKRIKGFVGEMSNIDSKTARGAGYLATAIIAMTVAEFLHGITKLATFGLGNLVSLGLELGGFAIAARPFLAAVKDLGPEGATGAKYLADAVVAMSTAELIDGITDFLGIGGDITQFGAKLASFGAAIAEFSTSIAGLTDSDLSRVAIAATAGKTMSDMVAAIPSTNGWLQTILGSKDIEAFGAGLKSFGGSLVEFSDSISGLSDSDLDHIKNAADAAQALVDIENNLSSKGGVWQEITGIKDIEGFGESLTAFGGYLVKFSESMTSLTDADLDHITKSADAAMALVNVENNLSSTGGIWQAITGFKDLVGFGEGIKNLGEGLISFGQSVEGLKPWYIDRVRLSGKMIEALKPFIDNYIDKTGGFAQLFAGEKDLSVFGRGLSALAWGLKEFVNFAAAVDVDKAVTDIGSTKELIKAMSEATDDIPIGDNYEFPFYADYMSSMSSMVVQLKEFLRNAKGIKNDTQSIIELGDMVGRVIAISNSIKAAELDDSDLTDAIENIQNLATALSDVSTLHANEDGALNKILEQIGTNAIDGFKEAFNSDVAVSTAMETVTPFLQTVIDSIHSEGVSTEFRNAGLSYIESIIEGLKSDEEQTKLKQVAGNVQRSVFNGINGLAGTTDSLYERFRRAGQNAVDGFANALVNDVNVIHKVYNSAFALGKSGVQGVNDGISARSPSRKFYESGGYAVKGFANALVDGYRHIYLTSEDMGKEAIKGISRSIQGLSSIILDDMDTQPTIRPVLDLSDVKLGIGQMNGMFVGANPTVGVIGNVNAIDTMMNRKLQNGFGESDVVSAIHALGASLGDNRGDTYNINGINYSADEAVVDAFRTLIRVTSIERRA